MVDLYEGLRKNREEAYNIVKAHGGRIDFVDDIIKGETDDDDDWDGDANEHSLPWTILSGDELLCDIAVLAVKCSEKEGELDFLAYEVDGNFDCMGWFNTIECNSLSDNEIYLYIAERYSE